MADQPNCTFIFASRNNEVKLISRFNSFIPGAPGSLLHQLSSKQQQETSEQEDHGFTDDTWSSNDLKLENETSILDSEFDTTDVGLCQAIEKVFLDLTKVAVVRQQNCE